MLKRMTDDEDFARTIIEIFLLDFPKQIEKLEQMLENGNLQAIECQAHTIKGEAANMSGEALREAASTMEKASKAGDIEAVRLCMHDLVARFERLKNEMNAYLDGQGI